MATAKKITKAGNKKSVEAINHKEASRKYIPTAEYQSVMSKQETTPIRVAYERRNRDLDPQLVWRGKDEQDWSDLVVHAPPIYIQEKVHPKVLIDDLMRRTKVEEKAEQKQIDLFSDFNGLPGENAKTEFYQHDANWTNRMILGDSLQVMASLAEREGLRGKVQCIYIDPPYGIKFNSNFQWSTTSRDVKDGDRAHITREPEQVKAFRDTWRDGIHSYLTYLRDRLTVARDLLTESGSIFVQIGDENAHRVRSLLDEVFGEENFCSEIHFRKTGSSATDQLANVVDHIIWFARDKTHLKYRQLYQARSAASEAPSSYSRVIEFGEFERQLDGVERENITNLPSGANLFQSVSLESEGPRTGDLNEPFLYRGKTFEFRRGAHWKTGHVGLSRLAKAGRLQVGGESIRFRMFLDDYPVQTASNVWSDVMGATGLIYVVQTNSTVIARCLLMTTDTGDLVLDPTCGSGTTAYVAEQWGRRWITADTSRVAIALARARVMGAKYPYYLLADSKEGLEKESKLRQTPISSVQTRGDIRQGFVYERVPHVTLKSIAADSEIEVIWEKFQKVLEPLRNKLNSELGSSWADWEIPRHADSKWPQLAKDLHTKWWEHRKARQKEVDASIASKAEYEFLYDRPYEDKKKVRVAGPFTVESLSPHRVLGVDENDELIDDVAKAKLGYSYKPDFAEMILENLKIAGVQQAHKEDKISFTSLAPWPGALVCAEGRYTDGNQKEIRAAIFIGPEFGTVRRPDLVEVAKEAGDAGFDVLITCAFNYDAHATEFSKLGRIPVLKARMNADLHMAEDLKNTGKGNLFVIFGEPDIDILNTKDGRIQLKVKGVDVFDPSSGEVRSDSADGIACWFVDTDYNEESFFVRHAYFLGANDPYKALKSTLKAEINLDAWETLHSDTSRPFDKPTSGRIAVKVINHLGDEVMKVFKVD
jgi:adenine-specific DNA-methyltransferase